MWVFAKALDYKRVTVILAWIWTFIQWIWYWELLQLLCSWRSTTILVRPGPSGAPKQANCWQEVNYSYKVTLKVSDTSESKFILPFVICIRLKIILKGANNDNQNPGEFFNQILLNSFYKDWNTIFKSFVLWFGEFLVSSFVKNQLTIKRAILVVRCL